MTPAVAALREALSQGTVFPHQYDAVAERVLMVTVPNNVLSAAGFLDQQVAQQASSRNAVSIEEFEAAASMLSGSLPTVIFHQGHCGSTLVSRLLAAASSTTALREPLALRTLAALVADAAAGDTVVPAAVAEKRLFYFLRSFAQGRSPAIVKASSICTDLARPLLDGDGGFRALFMCLQPEAFIATILAGPNNRADMTGFAGIRRKRLRLHGVETPALSTLSEGRLAALAWVSEAVSFSSAPRDGRFMPLDFDVFLRTPASSLQAAAAHLGVPVSDEAAQNAVNGPDMRRYSKAQQFDYSPALRDEVLAQARREHAAEIKAGLDWITALAGQWTPVDDALTRIDALRKPRDV